MEYFPLSGHFSESFHRPFEGTQISSAESVGSIVIGLYSVLFAYDGWSAIISFHVSMFDSVIIV